MVQVNSGELVNRLRGAVDAQAAVTDAARVAAQEATAGRPEQLPEVPPAAGSGDSTQVPVVEPAGRP